jgi:pantoate kinase
VQEKVRAFSPSGISSFFEICDKAEDGKTLADPLKIGARGGGFVTEKGVSTEVILIPAKRNKIQVEINGQPTCQAKTTCTVVRKLLEKSDSAVKVMVKHQIEVPVGAGFGTSAAGALGTALALSKALNLSQTYNELGKIAHAAEVQCKTGLGTVGPLMLGGCILTIEPGPPGTAVIDRIPLTSDHVIVAAVLGGIPTKSVLSSPEKRQAVNKIGRKTLEQILSDPSLDNFMHCCRDFAEKTGFMNDRLRRLVTLAEGAGAIGAAQNMVGDVIHAVTTSENAKRVAQAFMQVLPHERIITAKIDFQGARLLG